MAPKATKFAQNNVDKLGLSQTYRFKLNVNHDQREDDMVDSKKADNKHNTNRIFIHILTPKERT